MNKPLGMQTWSLLSMLSSTSVSAEIELQEIGFNFLEMAGSGNGTLRQFASRVGRIPIRGAHICSLDQDDNDIKEIISDYVNIFPNLEWLVFFRDFEKEVEEKDSAIIERFAAYGEKLKTIKEHLKKERKQNIKIVYHTYTPDYIGVQEEKNNGSSYRVAFELLPEFVMIQLDYYFASTANFMLYKYLADRKDDNRIKNRFHSIHLSSRSEETNDRVDLPPSPSSSIHTSSKMPLRQDIAYAFRNLELHYPNIEYILEINDVGSHLNSLENNFSNFQSYFSTTYTKSEEKPSTSSHLLPNNKEINISDLSWPGSEPLIDQGFAEEILEKPAVYIPFIDLQKTGKQGSLDPRYVNQRRNTNTLEYDFLNYFGNLQREKPAQIILEGSAGIGKSTFLAYAIDLFRREKARTNIPVLVLWIDYKRKKLERNDPYPIEKICDQVASIQHQIAPEFTQVPTSKTEQEQRTKQILQNFRQKNGYVVFVHDNIDKVGTGDRASECQVLEEIFSRFQGEGWESYYDTLIIACRPDTLSGLQLRDELRDDYKTFNMEPIVIAKGVEARLKYVEKSFAEEGVKMQTLGKAIVRRPAKSAERSTIGEKNIPKWWKSGEETKEVVVPIPYYNQTSGSQAREVLWDAGSPVFDPSRIVGLLSDRAESVLRYLSGASMRRAVTLTKAMITHPGIKKDLANKRTDSKEPKRTVRFYTIIDSLVDSSLGKKMELNFIANLLDPDAESAYSYLAARPHMDFFFKPFFFKYIESRYKSDLEAIYSDGIKKGRGESILVETEEIIPILREFGFETKEINRGFRGIELTSLVQRKNSRDDRHVGYFVNAYLLKAHALLMLEPGYIDNCVKYHQNEALRKLESTKGYDTSDLATRIKNTGIFFKILLENEAKFCEQIPSEAREKVAGLQIPSIGLSALSEYNQRLDFLKNLHSVDVKNQIVDFQSQFAAEISSIKDKIPLLHDMPHPIISPEPWVIDEF
jgi:hypothetical protein